MEDILRLTHILHLHVFGISDSDLDGLIEDGVRDLMHTDKLLDNPENDDLDLRARQNEEVKKGRQVVR